jgi:hypothetical protein
MGDSVDREVALSRRDKEIETEAARQAHYIRWCEIMSIPDACGHQPGYQRIVAIYIKYLMKGVNFRNKDYLRSATVRGYANSVNSLFKLRDMKPPIDMADPNNVSGILINNLVKEEDIARQRSPLDSAIFAELHHKSNVSRSQDSEQSTLFDLVVLGRYIGPRVSEYAQTTDKSVDYHVYPSGKQVIKAFTANDFRFFDKNSQAITDLSDASIGAVDRVRITWRIQKNRQNNQKVTLSSDKANKAICPVLAALRLVLRARRLEQPDSMPVACYRNKKGALAYITGSRIALHFRAAARAVRPTITKEEEQRYSAHSLRVWACVLLDEAGKSPDYIKKRLRWMGDSFRMYLRDTRVIQDQHREALRASSEEVMDIVGALPADILRLSTMSDGTAAGDGDDMGVYHDDMD